MKVLALRRPDICAACAAELPIGTRAAWFAAAREVRCLSCVDDAPAAFVHELPLDVAIDRTPPKVEAPPVAVPAPRGVGGASAQREYEKRSRRREERIRGAHPRLGGLILALAAEP